MAALIGYRGFLSFLWSRLTSARKRLRHRDRTAAWHRDMKTRAFTGDVEEAVCGRWCRINILQYDLERQAIVKRVPLTSREKWIFTSLTFIPCHFVDLGVMMHSAEHPI